ncbi:formate dehydrogenase accessory sulfurtransferase FdhD [Dyadobacter luticola]|uniref:Sulfur carrier protein FdhD n=1 Tax=Dyadobacter luticola TaxID=1979387 RepID=A0A5R9KSM4_9BACT|nr:formate dehydrogenase accessory sulfurtransferase FdhD [Dyadobacter luticola]TLU99271.1 formate dehydrogenase accessory sulfurtransferase FdhD [Dyadobacter luticola]
MNANPVTQHFIKRVNATNSVGIDDQLAVEEPLEIRIAYYIDGGKTEKAISVTMRTPGNDEELAVGFLFTEGIIQHAAQIEKVTLPVFRENTVVVTLDSSFEPKLGSLERNFYTTSSCGVCGKASVDAIKTASNYLHFDKPISIDRHILFKLEKQIAQRQDIFETTGGLHASSIFDQNGDFLLLREDVGRHNALDKLIGATLTAGLVPLSQHILLLSGRASFELIQKASMAGIQIVAAIGAPSSLAVQLAEESGITLIGFLKKDKFNVYSGFDRIQEI